MEKKRKRAQTRLKKTKQKTTKKDKKAKPSEEKKPSKEKKSESGDGDDGDDDGNNDDEEKKRNQYRIAAFLGSAVGVLTLLFLLGKLRTYRPQDMEISFQSFRERLLDSGTVVKLVVINDDFVDVYTTDSSTKPSCWFTISSGKDFEERLMQSYSESNIPPSQWLNVKSEHYGDPEDWLRHLPTLLYIAIVISIFRTSRSQTSKGPWNMTQMSALNVSNKVTTKFKDVAGMDEAKQEIMEFVSFLKEPERFTRLGAKVPNGAILMGPPGTGKTLLAKAVAGESDVPFFSVCGSDFVEMYVGVGPGRIRALFKEARKHKKAIVYIDEIDAIGRPRGRGIMSGANDERENTLNALLVEMDGFVKQQGQVIVLASTNVSTDQLDNALLRPGRFDRQINIDKPEIKERVLIFKLHLSPLKLQNRPSMVEAEKKHEQKLRLDGIVDDLYDVNRADPTEDELKAQMPSNVETKNDLLVLHRFAERMAHLTPGFVGADIANVCNEGALIAARNKESDVSLADLEAAVDRVIGGIERRSRVLSDFEKKVVAYHEAGHAVVGWFLKYCDPLMKISVIPRGSAALGYTQYLPKESRIYTTQQLTDRICGLLGGRVSELINFGHLSTGARDDLQKVTQLAYTQVSQFGMYPGGGHVSYPAPQSQGGYGLKPYSDELAEIFDAEVKKVVDICFKRTKDLLEEKHKEVQLVAEFLLKHEMVTRDDVIKLIGPRPFKDSHDSHPDDDTLIQ